MINKHPITSKFSYWFIKRFLDIVFAIILSISLSPLLLMISLVILISNGFPIFYKCEWHGIQGKRFDGYKFRTMHKNAHSEREDLQHLNEMDGAVFKISNDPRIIRFGKLLRKFSLDELPQIYSVIKGDMSFIGPRPSMTDDYLKYEDKHYQRLSVVPGISCLWQVSGRNEIDTFDDWVNLDLEYIDNWSLWLDTKIFFKTIIVVLKGSGK